MRNPFFRNRPLLNQPMTARTHSFPLSRFDPLPLFRQLCPSGPGFLESLNPMPKTGRYSVLPLRWRERYRYAAGRLEVIRDGKTETLPGNDDPFRTLSAILRDRTQPGAAETPFIGGFFGYLGYDVAGLVEDLPRRARNDIPVPDLQFYWVDVAAVYDHQKKQLTLASLDPAVDLRAWERDIRACAPEAGEEPFVIEQKLQPVLARTDFMAMVARAKDYIGAGDIYQVNLSCRFDGRMSGSSAGLYQHLRRVNPSPFACLLNFPEIEIISSSPERLVSLRGDLAETRPIAGTRPRGGCGTEDRRLGEELLCHPKERAEHIMLLDLERNDLGKVCRTATVEVDELMVLERYSHVTHIVSNVRGRLRPQCGPFELLEASFPGGTITGVPKKRCMEIIDELEPVRRGSYTGSAGYISACGKTDFNILIRSFQRTGATLTYQAGAGIVADSVPAREWQECLDKGEALRKVLEDHSA